MKLNNNNTNNKLINKNKPERSRWRREIGSFAEKCSKRAFAIPKLPSEFSKSIGFTL